MGLLIEEAEGIEDAENHVHIRAGGRVPAETEPVQHLHGVIADRSVLDQLDLPLRLGVGEDAGKNPGFLRVGLRLVQPADELVHFQIVQRAAVVLVEPGEDIVHRQ